MSTTRTLRACAAPLFFALAVLCPPVLTTRAMAADAASATEIVAAASDAPAVYLLDQEKWTCEEYRFTLEVKKRLRIETAAGMEHANQSIDFGGANSKKKFYQRLVAFSARTVRPDGTRVEVTAAMRQDTIVEKAREYELHRMKFAFPNVEPGAVLEWEYTLERENPLPWPWWEIQQRVPVKEAHFVVYSKRVRLQNYVVESYASRLFAPYCKRLPRTSDGEFDVYDFACHDLPAYRDEPLSPPENDSRIRMMFTWYPPRWQDQGVGISGTYTDEFWWSLDKFLEKGTKARALAQQIAGTSAPDGFEKIGAWLRRFKLDPSTRMNRMPGTADNVVETGHGTPEQLVALGKVVAEAAGYKAFIIETSDQAHERYKVDLPDLTQGTHWLLQVLDGGTYRYLDPECVHCRQGILPWRYAGRKNAAARFVPPEKITNSWSMISADLPRVPPELNVASRVERVVVAATGDTTVDGTAAWTGQLEQEQRDLLAGLGPDARREKFLEGEAGNPSNAAVTITDPDDMEHALQATYSLHVPGAAVVSGNTLVVSARDVLTRLLPIPVQETRTLPLWWPRPFTGQADVTFVVPDGFKSGELPEDTVLEMPGLRFGSRWTKGAAANEVRWSAWVVIEKTTIPVEQWPAVLDFAQQMRRALVQTCTFAK